MLFMHKSMYIMIAREVFLKTSPEQTFKQDSEHKLKVQSDIYLPNCWVDFLF